MKYQACLLIFFSLFHCALFSQSCLPEGIHFTRQSQVDSFQIYYPGCTRIEGNVKISGNDISNLSGLFMLDSIFGYLYFSYTSDLHDLVGLGNLKYIGGDFNIGDTRALHYLTGLDSLTTIDGNLEITWNDWLFSLNGLQHLTTVGGSVVIDLNWELTSLEGLDNLTSIGGSLMIGDWWGGNPMIWIHDNPILTECNIQSLCEYLADIPEMIGIYNNGPGCDNPHEIADSCGFEISCLPFGNYYFVSQANIDSFPSYYPDCSRLEGYTCIEGDDITHIDSLYGIDTIGGSISVCGNPLLADLNGLNNLQTVQGSFSLGYWEHGSNPLLTDMTGLEKLNYVGGEMLILGNGSFQNFNGLDSLEEIGLWFDIIQNPSLKSFEGLNSLHSV